MRKGKHSIMQDLSDERCYLCGKSGYLHLHHCLYGSKRATADKDGLYVWLCPECHEFGKDAVHGSSPEGLRRNLLLKRYAQACWEGFYGSRKDFIERYGKSYLGKDAE